MRQIILEQIDKRRIADGISDEEVCRRAGVNLRTLSRLRKGNNVTAETLEALSVYALGRSKVLMVVSVKDMHRLSDPVHDATLSTADAVRTAESSPAIPPSDMSAHRRCPDPAKAGAAG